MAPTGTVMTRIVDELSLLGHEVHVVTALPWYRTHKVESDWAGQSFSTESTPFGSVTRVNPFPGGDKRNLARRAVGFVGFSVFAGVAALRAGGWFRRVDVVLAMSPPLTLGITGSMVALLRRGKLVFNIQDVFPDAAVRTGSITNTKVIRLAMWLERFSYHRAAAVTVLSDDLKANVTTKVKAGFRDRIHVIPNFVDTNQIEPSSRMTDLRAELGIGVEPVVLYAGNVGFSQALELMIDAARVCTDATFLVNGEGAARLELERAASGLSNVRFSGYQPTGRLCEVLATGDVHVVPLRAGLGDVSVPSKTYSSLAAARPVIASIDPGTEIPNLLAAAGAGISVAPDDPNGFIAAIRRLIDNSAEAAAMGVSGRAWVEQNASPAAVGRAYDDLFRSVSCRR